MHTFIFNFCLRFSFYFVGDFDNITIESSTTLSSTTIDNTSKIMLLIMTLMIHPLIVDEETIDITNDV